MSAHANPRLLLALAIGGLLAPGLAIAQVHGGMHVPMDMPMPEPTQAKGAPAKNPAAEPPTTHARHHPIQMSMHDMPMPDMPMHDMPMHGRPMDHPAMEHARSPAPDAPRTPIPVPTDADRAAAVPPPSDHPAHDNSIQSFVLFNRLEAFDADEGRGTEWEARAWIGTDLDRVWLRSEGEHSGGRTHAADLEVLYGRSVSPWWDVVAGVRHDFKPGDAQDFVAIGVQGLAPYKFEIEATAYIGQAGRTAARVEVEYEALLTNRLVLQPLVELNFHGKDDPARGIGTGLGTTEAGLRLRYEFSRRFAPYIGVTREWSFGRTADFRRGDGGAINDTRIVAGLRIWF